MKTQQQLCLCYLWLRTTQNINSVDLGVCNTSMLMLHVRLMWRIDECECECALESAGTQFGHVLDIDIDTDTDSRRLRGGVVKRLQSAYKYALSRSPVITKSKIN